MNNIDELLAAGKSAMAAKAQLEQRIADNQDNWNRTSNTVKDVWTQLGLAPRKFKVGQAVFTCDNQGITQDAQAVNARDPQTLKELQGLIKEYLDKVRMEYDSKMQP